MEVTLTDTPDVDREILLSQDKYEDFYNACRANKYTLSLCNYQTIRKRLKDEYGKNIFSLVSVPGMSRLEQYYTLHKMIDDIEDMFENIDEDTPPSSYYFLKIVKNNRKDIVFAVLNDLLSYADQIEVGLAQSAVDSNNVDMLRYILKISNDPESLAGELREDVSVGEGVDNIIELLKKYMKL